MNLYDELQKARTNPSRNGFSDRHVYISEVERLFKLLSTDIEKLKGNEYKVTYFTEIGGTAGTITIPQGATILLDQFSGGVDAYASTIDTGQPTGIFPETTGGDPVDVATFDALGNYTLTDTPSAYPVALIYVLKISAIDYSNLNLNNILSIKLLESTQEFISPRITSITSSATPTPNSNTTDHFKITALAANATITTPTGTPVDGQKLIISIKDNGTARTLNFDSGYRFSSDLTAPTTTIINKEFYLGFVYNALVSKWDNLAQLNNFT